MSQLLDTETLVIELLLVASLVALLVRRIRIPYTVSLVVVGLLITSQEVLKFSLTSELILTLFVPPLVFEAAFHLEFRQLRENLLQILVLAVPGVIVTTLIVGGLVSWGTQLPIATALVFGALISASDPVAVIALFRSLGAPKRLAVTVEGESLFNDGTAIVIFNLMLSLAVPSIVGESSSFDFIKAFTEFITVSVGGLLIGVALGWLTSQLIARVDDYLIETSLTTVLAFGAYLLAERFHLSGVLSVVAAGIVCGNFGPKGMSPTTKIVLYNFWEYLAFVANSLIFLLIGLDVNISQIINQLGPIGIGVLAVLVSRIIVVYGLSFLVNLVLKNKMPLNYLHVLFWGGLRGAVSLALALSLPIALQQAELVKVMAYGVVLFTLLGQGTTMQLLLSKLGFLKKGESQINYERTQGRLMAVKAARERVEKLYQDKLISKETWETLTPDLERKIELASEVRQKLLKDEPELQLEELNSVRKEALRAERSVLTSLQSNGVISEIVYEELITEVDNAFENGEIKDVP